MAELYLVRHGQASFGAADYDRLSPTGEEQSRRLGRWLAQSGLEPDTVIHGALKRQRDTARLCFGSAAGLDWLEVAGFGEFDHRGVLHRHAPQLAEPDALQHLLANEANPRRAYQNLFEAAVARWTGGAHDGDYCETWQAFRARVLDGLRSVLSRSAQRTVAFTSGGPITAILQHTLGLPDAAAFSMNWPLVNTGITRLRFSRRTGALTLATYNAYPHLELARDPALVTFR